MLKKSDTWIIETRNSAIINHRTKYWTGRKCARGHESRRYVSSGICCKCNYENSQAYQRRKTNEHLGVEEPMTRVSYMVRRGHEQTILDYVEIINKTEV